MMEYRVLPCGDNCRAIEEDFVRCFPIAGQERAILNEMLSAAEALRDGKLTGAPNDRPVPAQLYGQGGTSFLYMP